MASNDRFIASNQRWIFSGFAERDLRMMKCRQKISGGVTINIFWLPFFFNLKASML